MLDPQRHVDARTPEQSLYVKNVSGLSIERNNSTPCVLIGLYRRTLKPLPVIKDRKEMGRKSTALRTQLGVEVSEQTVSQRADRGHDRIQKVKFDLHEEEHQSGFLMVRWPCPPRSVQSWECWQKLRVTMRAVVGETSWSF